MMLCPKCHDQVMVVVERNGIEIDYCGGCRGIWLDRGELDKLIAQASSSETAFSGSHHRGEVRRGTWHDHDYDEHERDEDRPRKRRGRIGGFLEDIFDFD